jgi:hypothetical protein
MVGTLASVAEHAVPRDAVRSHDLPLGLLVAARDAARMALRGLHLGPAVLERVLLRLGWGTLTCPALRLIRHCSSKLVEAAFSPAYHVTTE